MEQRWILFPSGWTLVDIMQLEGLRTGSDLILISVDAFLMGASGT